MTILATYEQQPAERQDYDIYYRNDPDGRPDYLDDGDDLDDSAGMTTVSVFPAGLNVSAITIKASDRVKLWISGGTSGVKYKVTLLVHTALGRIKEVEVFFKIKDE